MTTFKPYICRIQTDAFEEFSEFNNNKGTGALRVAERFRSPTPSPSPTPSKPRLKLDFISMGDGSRMWIVATHKETVPQTS